MKVLAVETATDALSCAPESSGTVFARHAVEPRRPAEKTGKEAGGA